MAKFFTIQEMIFSETAKKYNIPNKPGSIEIQNLQWLMDNCLDKIRELWANRIHVDSGYRCPELNKRVGGALNSQHKSGCAADITVGSQKDNELLFNKIKSSEVSFDQLIDEYHFRWIHISCKYGNYANRKQIVHIR